MSPPAMPVTPPSWSYSVLGLGLGTSFQLVPSQCSVTVRSDTWSSSTVSPTAQMSLADTASMARSSAKPEPVGTDDTRDQAVPSQCTTIGFPLLVLGLSPRPTAQMSFAETTEMPLRALPWDPRFGLGTFDHL